MDELKCSYVLLNAWLQEPTLIPVHGDNTHNALRMAPIRHMRLLDHYIQQPTHGEALYRYTNIWPDRLSTAIQTYGSLIAKPTRKRTFHLETTPCG